MIISWAFVPIRKYNSYSTTYSIDQKLSNSIIMKFVTIIRAIESARQEFVKTTILDINYVHFYNFSGISYSQAFTYIIHKPIDFSYRLKT